MNVAVKRSKACRRPGCAPRVRAGSRRQGRRRGDFHRRASRRGLRVTDRLRSYGAGLRQLALRLPRTRPAEKQSRRDHHGEIRWRIVGAMVAEVFAASRAPRADLQVAVKDRALAAVRTNLPKASPHRLPHIAPPSLDYRSDGIRSGCHVFSSDQSSLVDWNQAQSKRMFERTTELLALRPVWIETRARFEAALKHSRKPRTAFTRGGLSFQIS